jgi:dienelactone hydrolase
VFDALEATSARFKIDPARIALRGFSMGGAGAWHIGLHHPHRWAAIEAGAGFTETRNYANQVNAPPHFEKLWRIYDAVDVARNAFNVPIVGYGGEIDPQLKASQNIQEQLTREGMLEGLRAIFLVGPNTPHRFHPDSKKESDAFLDKYVGPGRNAEPQRIRFVTYTTRYGECAWIAVEGMERHYERAEVDAAGDGRVATKNVSRLSVRRSQPVEIDGQSFPTGGTFEKAASGKWRTAARSERALRKKPGQQGPIDDAFMDSFLVVRPTAPHPGMERFLNEFAKWMRGDPRTVEAASLTEAQIRDHNLILFGDPSSNAVVRRVLPKLPMKWPTGGKALAMIYPNPLNPARYVVLNSGHTFGEAEFRGTNALLFPRLGDWAILNADGSTASTTGFFDESWRVAR